MNVAIIGQGYVGSALGIEAYKAGHEVLGIEIDEKRRDILKDKVRYSVTGDYSKINGSEVVVIAVPTPLNEDRLPDLSFLESACESLASELNSSVLVVNESTSYPGTLRNFIAPILGEMHLYAAAPERIDPGNKRWRIDNTPRLLCGLTSEATSKALDFYRSFCKDVVTVSTPEVAEAAKLFENTFRHVNIALANEFAQIAQGLGISSYETLSAASTKPYGFMSFMPSIGVGGHCIPVDPTYLSFAAERKGVEASFVYLANKLNSSMPRYLLQRIIQIMDGSISGKSIQVAGISYKADVPDTRESPALALISLMRAHGAKVTWHDEVVSQWQSERSTPIACVDLGVIATSHSGVNYSTWKNENVMVIDVSPSPNVGWPKFL